MAKRTDIKSILIIGAGPIIIGQACEFDYSGAQACKALREEGCNVMDQTDDSEFGKFGWVIDPEGNKVELWEPPAAP